MKHRTRFLVWAMLLAFAMSGVTGPWAWGLDVTPPARPVKLVFIHHSTGQNWLADGNGGLGIALRDAGYFTSDTNYGWGPGGIGDRTDIGNWWEWFRSSDAAAILQALYAESGKHSSYSRLGSDPGGPNEIVMFKSCFPNSALRGRPGDAVPAIASNPLKGESAGSSAHTVANAKGIYIDLLNYFKTRQDKLFVVITAPPLSDATYAANARAFNDWLVNDWLDGYTGKNVSVFDFYNVLTSNGGNANANDVGLATGNHHRVWNGAVQHKTDDGTDVLAYPSPGGDDHPSAAGGKKAAAEFVPLLNAAYNAWRASRATLSRPTPSVSPVRRNRVFWIAGRLSPAHASATTVGLYLYRKVGGRYRTYRSSTIRVAAGATRYRVRCRLRYAGAWGAKTYHADAGHGPSWSPTRYFRVR